MWYSIEKNSTFWKRDRIGNWILCWDWARREEGEERLLKPGDGFPMRSVNNMPYYSILLWIFILHIYKTKTNFNFFSVKTIQEKSYKEEKEQSVRAGTLWRDDWGKPRALLLGITSSHRPIPTSPRYHEVHAQNISWSDKKQLEQFFLALITQYF